MRFIALVAFLPMLSACDKNGGSTPASSQPSATPASSRPIPPEIFSASENGDLEKVKTLVASQPELVSSRDEHGRTPLHQAAYRAHKDVMEFLIANKADINAKDAVGFTPLHFVAFWVQRKDVAELLLTKGAEVNAKDNWGQTPLNMAAAQGSDDVVELLVFKGADINAKDKDGNTPLKRAGMAGRKDVAAFLRQHGGTE